MSRRVLALAALCVALGVAALIEPGGAPRSNRPTFTLPAIGAVQAIHIQRTGQADVHVQRGATGWTVQPGGAPADRHAMAAIEAALAEPLGMDQQTQVAEGDDGTAFGLGPHALRVRLVSAGEATAIAVGKVVDGRRTFVRPERAPAGVVYRAQANLRGLFDRPPHTWPERRLFDIDFNEVASLRRLDGARESWHLRRTAADAPWVLVHPDLTVGQQEAISVTNSLVTAKADRFEAPAAPFAARATLEGRTFGGAIFGLEMSGAPGGVLRVRRLGEATVATLPAWLGRFVDVHASDLRERRVLFVPPEAIRAVVTEGPRPLRIERGDTAWRMVRPEPIEALDTDRVMAFLSNLSGLRATGFATALPESAFAAPWMTLHLRLADQREVVLEIGAEYRNGARFVRQRGAPPTGAVISPVTLAGLTPTPADLRGP